MPSSSAFVALTPSRSPSSEPSLDLASLRSRVAGAIRGEVRVVAEALGGEAVDQLGRLAALRERERAEAVLDEQSPGAWRPPRAPTHEARARRRSAAGSRARRCARGAARRRRSTTVTRSPSSAAPSSPGFEIVAEARSTCGLGSVDASESPQPPKDVRDVRSEDAAVDVRFVDDDVAQVREEVSPAIVIRQDADVQHVRVREDHVGRATDLAAVLERRVAVVDRRAQPGEPEGGRGRGTDPAPAPSSGRGRARGPSGLVRRASRTGRLNARVLPEAVPVATQTCSPRADCLPGRALVGVQRRDADRRPHGRCECAPVARRSVASRSGSDPR